MANGSSGRKISASAISRPRARSTLCLQFYARPRKRRPGGKPQRALFEFEAAEVEVLRRIRAGEPAGEPARGEGGDKLIEGDLKRPRMRRRGPVALPADLGDALLNRQDVFGAQQAKVSRHILDPRRYVAGVLVGRHKLHAALAPHVVASAPEFALRDLRLTVGEDHFDAPGFNRAVAEAHPGTLRAEEPVDRAEPAIDRGAQAHPPAHLVEGRTK